MTTHRLHAVPHNLVITTARPDMVYGDTVALVELTIPANSFEHLCSTQSRKTHISFYQTLLSDLDSLGRKASLVTIEIGSLGQSLTNSRKVFMQSFPNILNKSSARQLFNSAARTAISASHIIFLAKKSN